MANTTSARYNHRNKQHASQSFKAFQPTLECSESTGTKFKYQMLCWLVNEGKHRCFFLLQLKFIMFIEARIYIIHAFVNTMKSLYCVYVCVVFKLKSLWISWPATVSCTSKNLGEGTNIDEVPSLFLSEHQYWWGGIKMNVH